MLLTDARLYIITVVLPQSFWQAGSCRERVTDCRIVGGEFIVGERQSVECFSRQLELVAGWIDGWI